jgi:hypothetical protein
MTRQDQDDDNETRFFALLRMTFSLLVILNEVKDLTQLKPDGVENAVTPES